MCDRSLFRSIPFLIFCAANLILYLWISMPYVYLVDYSMLIDNVKLSSAAVLLSLAGVGRIVGQIVFGAIGDARQVSASVLYGIGAILAGLCTLLVPLIAYSYPGLAVYASVYGASASVSYVLPMVCLVELLGLTRAVNAFGILQLVQGVATLLGTPIAGWLYDAYASYSASFYIAGAMMLVSGLALLPIPCILKCH
jgi:MFS family permease